MLRLNAIALAVAAIVLFGAGSAPATGLLANWTLNDGGTVGNTIGAGTTVADSSGNGFTGTISGGSDTLQSVAGVIGNGLYFSGDDSTNYSYISAPANVGSNSLGGMNSLTISVWVNIPANSYNNKVKEALDLWDTTSSSSPKCYVLGTEYGNLASQKGLYYGFAGAGTPSTDNSGSVNFWTRTGATGWTRQPVGTNNHGV